MFNYYRNKRIRINAYRNKYPELFTEEFDEFFKREILPFYEGKIVKKTSEKQDKKTLVKYIISVFLFFSSFFIVGIISLFSPLYGLFAFILLFIICILFLSSKSTTPNAVLVEERKEKIFPKLFSYIGHYKKLSVEDANYDLFSYLNTLSLIQKMPKYNPNFYDDRLVINYKEHIVDMCELKFFRYHQKQNSMYKREGGGHSAFFRIRLNGGCTGRTVITRKIFDGKNLLDYAQKNKFKNKDFTKYYNISYTDENEMHKFITNDLINRLIEFAQKNKFCDLNLSIENGFVNLIYCTGSNANMFEVPSWIVEDMKKSANEFRRVVIEFLECLSILDYVKIEEIADT